MYVRRLSEKILFEECQIVDNYIDVHSSKTVNLFRVNKINYLLFMTILATMYLNNNDVKMRYYLLIIIIWIFSPLSF